MSAPLSASVLFRVCLPMVSWAGRVPSAAETAAPGLSSRAAGDVPDNINRLVQEAYTNAGIPGNPLSSAFFTDATIDLQSGYEWDPQRADGSTPDLSPCDGPGTSSARIDIGAESGNRFLSAERRGTEIARFGRGKGSGAYPLSRGEKTRPGMRAVGPRQGLRRVPVESWKKGFGEGDYAWGRAGRPMAESQFR